MQDTACLKQFEEYLTDVKKASANTMSSYLRDIRQLSAYLSAHELGGLLNASEDVLSQYATYLRSSGKSAATVARSIASMKSFYAYMVSQGIIEKNPATNLMAEKAEHKLPQILTGKEVELLLEQPQCVDMKG